jgi:hypothetical protein
VEVEVEHKEVVEEELEVIVLLVMVQHLYKDQH